MTDVYPGLTPRHRTALWAVGLVVLGGFAAALGTLTAASEVCDRLSSPPCVRATAIVTEVRHDHGGSDGPAGRVKVRYGTPAGDRESWLDAPHPDTRVGDAVVIRYRSDDAGEILSPPDAVFQGVAFLTLYRAVRAEASSQAGTQPAV